MLKIDPSSRKFEQEKKQTSEENECLLALNKVTEIKLVRSLQRTFAAGTESFLSAQKTVNPCELP